MTPLQLLEEVQDRFILLFHDDEAILHRLLRRALGKYQDKAGVLLQMNTSETLIPLPDLCAGIAACSDAKGRYIPAQLDTEDCALRLESSAKHQSPYVILYFANLRDWPLEKPLPSECLELVSDYLEALIALPNTGRAWKVMASTHLSTADLPSTEEAQARITALEIQMEEAKAVIPPLLVL